MAHKGENQAKLLKNKKKDGIINCHYLQNCHKKILVPKNCGPEKIKSPTWVQKLWSKFGHISGES